MATPNGFGHSLTLGRLVTMNMFPGILSSIRDRSGGLEAGRIQKTQAIATFAGDEAFGFEDPEDPARHLSARPNKAWKVHPR